MASGQLADMFMLYNEKCDNRMEEKNMNPIMTVIVGVLGLTVAACTDSRTVQKAPPPPPHSPAALDMRGTV